MSTATCPNISYRICHPPTWRTCPNRFGGLPFRLAFLPSVHSFIIQRVTKWCTYVTIGFNSMKKLCKCCTEQFVPVPASLVSWRLWGKGSPFSRCRTQRMFLCKGEQECAPDEPMDRAEWDCQSSFPASLLFLFLSHFLSSL